MTVSIFDKLFYLHVESAIYQSANTELVNLSLKADSIEIGKVLIV